MFAKIAILAAVATVASADDFMTFAGLGWLKSPATMKKAEEARAKFMKAYAKKVAARHHHSMVYFKSKAWKIKAHNEMVAWAGHFQAAVEAHEKAIKGHKAAVKHMHVKKNKTKVAMGKLAEAKKKAAFWKQMAAKW